MKAVAGVSGYRGWRGRHSVRRRLVISGAALAVVGGIAALFLLAPNKNAAPEKFSSAPAVEAPTPIKAKFTAEERRIALRFIQTAVARKNLDEAWTLIDDNLKGGLSREEWLTGNNPVIPYPLDKLQFAPYKIDYSYTDSALLEIALLAKKGSGIRSQLFLLRLVKVGTGQDAHWLVDTWVPRATPVVPQQ